MPPNPQRSDLNTQPIRVPPSQQYGQGVADERAQKAIPLPQAPTTPAPTLAPGALDFAGPTERPNEPVTAGLPLGPGPGPEILGFMGIEDTPELEVREMIRRFPQYTEHLMKLLDYYA